jgi:Integral membrane protein, interacts with FtsH
LRPSPIAVADSNIEFKYGSAYMNLVGIYSTKDSVPDVSGGKDEMSGNRFANSSMAATGVDAGLRSHMLRTYNLISLGLFASAVSAYTIAETSFRSLFFSPDGALTILGTIGMFAPLGILLFASFGAIGKTLTSVKTVYWAFTLLQGIGLSVLVMHHTGAQVAQALAMAGFTFAATSLYGYTTRKNLSGMGSFMVIGLIGIMVAMIVNIFLGSPAVDFAISVIGIIVFAGLTAYDTQNLKESYSAAIGEEELDRARYWSALGLYLNILNLVHFFLNLTRE